MTYVDGFVLAVPNEHIEAYKAMAERACAIWMEHGALSYVEALGDDTPVGELTSFPRSVHLKENETVVFSWITYASREDRDAIMKKVMEDPRLKHDMETMPFDGKRMIYGGFRTIVSS
ncbi:DUF1428 domain-containing protein [Rhizorhabdus sp.]|uniref:DUF1428 domain-containing protein n=2 Tax=Rhizorhabdus sp. TaxID=1968843 RepID=UPI0035B49987